MYKHVSTLSTVLQSIHSHRAQAHSIVPRMYRMLRSPRLVSYDVTQTQEARTSRALVSIDAS